ncbi:MAG: PfaD family polyunsaturated fatty acid/polyketide biosynthesis protein [SAR324 cluster bacterium]|nr:PfaD family polyunsaturated fatty acid/polyketide biosynthesis protein [SAR324 cluster bacterium]
MSSNQKRVHSNGKSSELFAGWSISEKSLVREEAKIKQLLLDLNQPCYVIQNENGVGVGHEIEKISSKSHNFSLSFAPALTGEELGSQEFKQDYGLKYAYHGGAMANGISSEEMVVALGKAGFMASFGAAGLLPKRIEKAIRTIQQELPHGPYLFNLIHSPNETALERQAVDLFLKYGICHVEASAFLKMTIPLVYYRVAGLHKKNNGEIEIRNRVMGKISRSEIATHFMSPPPQKLVQSILEQGAITEEQASLAEQVSMADDITVEADSGGHTDNQPLISLLPSIISLRDQLQETYGYSQQIRVGAAGGIGTPSSVLAAFAMGAAYVTTGSVNQSCVEAGTCEHTKKLLAQVGMADVMMAPASDMFEQGGQLQVVKRGTMFPMRAQKLYAFYKNYNSLEDIPTIEREELESEIFRKPLESVWEETQAYFMERDPEHLEEMKKHPKRIMALIFRWYLGVSSHWSNNGEKGREIDYQIWCGPSMGAFNAWAKNSCLEEPATRKVSDVAFHLMNGAAYLSRLQFLKIQGIHFPASFEKYRPVPRDRL